MPRDPEEIFEEAGAKYGIDPDWGRAIAHVESGNRDQWSSGRPMVSGAGAEGRMQIMPANKPGLGITNSFDPEQSIPGAFKLIDDALRRNNDDTILAVREYHGGPDRSKWGPANAAYFPLVLAAYKQIKTTKGGGGGMPKSTSTSSDDASLADLEAQLRGKPASAALSSPGSTSSSDAGLAELEKQLRGTPKAVEVEKPKSQPPEVATANQSQQAVRVGLGGALDDVAAPQDTLSRVGAGIGQTITNVARGFERLALWGDQASPALAALDRVTGLVPSENKLAALTADRDAYQQQHGSDPVAIAGNVMGDLALTTPVMGPAGRIATGGVNALLGGGRVAGAVAPAVSGAAQGATGAALTAGNSDQPIGQQIGTGAALGFGLGALGGAIGGGLNALTGGLPEEAARLAQIARDKYKIPIAGDRLASSPAGQMFSSVVRRQPFSGSVAHDAEVKTAVTRAVGQEFGATDVRGNPAGRLTEEVFDRARGRLGQVFDGVAQRTGSIRADQPLANDFGRIVTDMRQTLPTSEQAPIMAQLRNIQELFTNGNGAIDGQTYQALTRKGAPLDRVLQSKDPNVRFAASQIREALDDVMQRSAPPDTVQDLLKARSQWRAMLAAQDAADKSPLGMIDPNALKVAVKKYYDRIGNAGNLGEITRIGQLFLGEPPNSGSPERYLYGLGLLSAPGMLMHDPVTALKMGAGLAASAATARGLGGVLRSDLYTNALINNALSPGPRAGNPLLQYLPGVGQLMLQREMSALSGDEKKPANALAGP